MELDENLEGAFFAYETQSGGRDQIRPRTGVYHLGVFAPCRHEHPGCAAAFLVDPDRRYALNLLRVLTAAAPAAAKNRALRSINSPVC